jgi:hypothetical protein
VDDATGVAGEDAVCEGVANVFGKADKEPMVFARFRRKVRVIDAKVHRFVPYEAEEGADVDGGAVEELEGNAVMEGWRGHVVEDEADVLRGEEPRVFRGTRSVEDGISDAFDVLPTSLGEVLMLHVWFTLPVSDGKGAKDVFDTGTGFDGSMVTNETAWGSPFTDIVLEGIGKFLFGFHTMDITHEGSASTKELSHGRTVIDCRGVGVNGVCGDIFVATRRVESGVG